MSRMQFDVKYKPQIESGEYKVETERGAPVHILSFETLGPLPICYQVGNGMDADFPPHPEVYFANEKGECSYPPCSLFIATPEEELTEFEQCLADTIMCYEGNEDHYAYLKDKAAELISIALKQLQPEIDAEITRAYENGILYGKAEALED